MSAILWTIGTIVVYAAARAAYLRTQLAILTPALVTIAVMMACLAATRTPYDEYEHGTRVIAFLLGPAIVALGVPLALQMSVMKRNAGGISTALVTGALAGIIVAVVVAKSLGATPMVVRSLAPRSATTPIALAITARLGGIPALSAVVSIVSGAIGGSGGVWLLRRVGVTSRLATGLALGAAAHGLGTARAAHEGATEGAASGMAMGITGLLTALLAPLIVSLVS